MCTASPTFRGLSCSSASFDCSRASAVRPVHPTLPSLVFALVTSAAQGLSIRFLSTEDCRRLRPVFCSRDSDFETCQVLSIRFQPRPLVELSGKTAVVCCGCGHKDSSDQPRISDPWLAISPFLFKGSGEANSDRRRIVLDRILNIPG
jgi:hypothetical protein